MPLYFFSRDERDGDVFYGVTNTLEQASPPNWESPTSRKKVVALLELHEGQVVRVDPATGRLCPTDPPVGVNIVTEAGEEFPRSYRDGALTNNLELLPSDEVFMRKWNSLAELRLMTLLNRD